MEQTHALARIGFGGGAIGGLYASADDTTARGALDAAWEYGIRYFDTAPLYGSGLSEQRLGAFLAGKPRSDFRISTKVGRILTPKDDAPDTSGSLAAFSGALPFTPVFDFSADGIRRSLESSLERLGVQYVDIGLIHDPDAHMDQAIDESWPALERLRDEGLVRQIGAGMNECAPLIRIVKECNPDIILVAGRYSLLDRSAADELFPLCLEQGVQVVGAGTFNSGILAKPAPEEGARFFYKPTDPATLARARRIAAICDTFGVPLPAAAIAFTLQHPAITSIVLGMRSADEVNANVAYARTQIPKELWRALRTEGLLS